MAARSDKQQIYMTWKGFRHGPKEVIDRLNRGETVDPGTYYFRTTPYFETSSEKVCLDEPYLLDRHWLARGERADVPGIPGVVGNPPSRGGLQEIELASLSLRALEMILQLISHRLGV